MSYLVLARKLRPARFKDLIGQESISQTLINAIASDRVAHAFLFTGPRGTGKTSTARILTKALNCSQPVDNEPCNLCENCEEINKGIATDVMEIDAASNRGIEYIRELRAGVKFSPAKCKYKTYIIDEVHMLTTESFNALLKTLEEPPPHVKFILATTDHHKVPSTVISRCQRFDFTNVASMTLLEYLKKVARSESIEISEKSLNLVVKASCGGVRDALTTMDMLISFGGDTVDDEKVIELLGINDAAEIDLLLEGIIAQDLEKVLAISRKLASNGRSLTHLVIDLMKTVKDLSMVTGLSRSKIQWKEFLPDQLELYQKLSDKVTQETLQQYFQILLDVENQIKRSAQAQICFEMGLIKLCSISSLVGVAEVLSLLRGKKAVKKKLLKTTPDVKLTEKPFVQPANAPDKLYGESNPIDLRPAFDYSQMEPTGAPSLNQPPPVEVDANLTSPQTEGGPNLQNGIENWKAFVDYAAKNSHKYLISLLRTAEIIEISDKTMVIGVENINLFNEEKKFLVREEAQKFFSSKIEVNFQEQKSRNNSSLKGLKDAAEEKKDQELKEAARISPQVKLVQEIFPGSEIKNIKIIRGEND